MNQEFLACLMAWQLGSCCTNSLKSVCRPIESEKHPYAYDNHDYYKDLSPELDLVGTSSSCDSRSCIKTKTNGPHLTVME